MGIKRAIEEGCCPALRSGPATIFISALYRSQSETWENSVLEGFQLPKTDPKPFLEATLALTLERGPTGFAGA
jgi:hypothetical protein